MIVGAEEVNRLWQYILSALGLATPSGELLVSGHTRPQLRAGITARGSGASVNVRALCSGVYNARWN